MSDILLIFHDNCCYLVLFLPSPVLARNSNFSHSFTVYSKF